MTDFEASVRYVTVYDVRTVQPANWPLAAAMAAAAICFLILLVLGRRGLLAHLPAGQLSRVKATLLGGGGFVLLVLLAAGSVANEYLGARRLRSRLASGKYERVEGQVTHFVRGDRGGHRDESWTVVSRGKEYRYRYSHSKGGPGFRASAGPVRGGARVRIADVDGHIARLEIEAPPLRVSDF